MIRLLASMLAALALFLSPMVMANGAAVAQSSAQMGDDCAAMHHSSPDNQKSDVKMSCAACVAIPAAPAGVGAQTIAPAPSNGVLPTQMLAGIRPESETPPPRFASEI